MAGAFGIGNHSTVQGRDVGESLVGSEDNTTINAGAGDDVVRSDVTFGDNILINGSFEDNSIGSRGWGLFNSIPGWSSWGRNPIELQSSTVSGGAADGDTVAELDSTRNSGLYQFVNGLTLGEEVRLSFDFSARVGVAEASNTIEVWWSGRLIDTITADGTGLSSPDWQNKTYIVEGTGSGNDWIAFRAVGTSDGTGGLIDTASVQRFSESTIGGNDMLNGEEGNDSLSGGAGRDWLEGGVGADHLNGGADSDTAYYANASEGVRVNLALGVGRNGEAEGDTYISIENAHGSNHNDVLIGDDNANRLIGRDGEDHLQGGGGKDYLLGGRGADILDGGDGEHDTAEYDWSSSGVTVNLTTGQGTGGYAEGDTLINIEHVYGSHHNDTLIGDANTNRLIGNDGDDVLDGRGGRDILIGGAGADTLIGGEGNVDAADYQTSAAAVEVDLINGGTAGDAAGDTYDGIEVVYGSAYGDIIFGDDENNRLVGNDGDDVLNGRGGRDILIGGAGADTLIGGEGNVDAADYQTSETAVEVDLTNGGTAGDAAGDTYDGIEFVYGSAFDDTIFGDAGRNRLIGNEGNDVLDGRDGNDYLLGGAGNDQLTGGSGRDVFLFEGAFGADVISDFEAGTGIGDRIWFRDMGVNDLLDLTVTDVGADVSIGIAGFGSLTLTGISSSELVLDDFIF